MRYITAASEIPRKLISVKLKACKQNSNLSFRYSIP